MHDPLSRVGYLLDPQLSSPTQEDAGGQRQGNSGKQPEFQGSHHLVTQPVEFLAVSSNDKVAAVAQTPLNGADRLLIGAILAEGNDLRDMDGSVRRQIRRQRRQISGDAPAAVIEQDGKGQVVEVVGHPVGDKASNYVDGFTGLD